MLGVPRAFNVSLDTPKRVANSGVRRVVVIYTVAAVSLTFAE
jgi:hypothetical protein